MKKVIFGFIFLVFLSMPIFTQGLYLDIGINDIGLRIRSTEDDAYSNFGVSTGLKAGYGPFGNTPLYLVGELVYSVSFKVGYDDESQASWFVGPGIIYYPIPLIQTGLTLGYSQQNFYSYSSPGFGWNISAAIDFGKSNHGCLLGLNYSGAFNMLDDPFNNKTNKTMLKTDLGVFIKYAYRKKVSGQALAGGSLSKNKRNASGQSGSNSGIDEAVSKASNNLISKLPERSRVAVISISSNNEEKSAIVVDEIEYQLVNSGKFTIVDRKTLDTIRSEQNFQMSGEVSDKSAVSIGQMLGANIVITGNIIGTGTRQRLSIRALDVRTAEIVAMVREDF